MRTPYEILGVAPNSSEEEIKKAYKNLSRRWHPDKNPTNQGEAGDKIKEINGAYEILGDREKRAMYDRFGTVDGAGPDINTMFAQMFGASHGHGFAGRRYDPLAQYRILQHVIPVTLADLYCGSTVEFEVVKRMSSTNERQRQENNSNMERVRQRFSIMRGMRFGVKYQIGGQGHWLQGQNYGDLVLVFVQSENDRHKKEFVRVDDDLYCTVQIYLKEALLGFKHQFMALDGRTVAFTHAGPFFPKNRKIVPKHGFPKLEKRRSVQEFGDLYLDFEIIDEKLSEATREQLQKILPDPKSKISEMSIRIPESVTDSTIPNIDVAQLTDAERDTPELNSDEPIHGHTRAQQFGAEGVECRTQ
jgi:curved DNA-binding protein